jgi:hypothetical protein
MGPGREDIGGEIQVSDIEYAKFLKNRGYVVDPIDKRKWKRHSKAARSKRSPVTAVSAIRP